MAASAVAILRQSVVRPSAVLVARQRVVRASAVVTAFGVKKQKPSAIAILVSGPVVIRASAVAVIYQESPTGNGDFFIMFFP